MVVEMAAGRQCSFDNMSVQFSIVIICRNEAAHIGQTISSLLPLHADIVVYDSGSTDGTLELLQQLPVRLHAGPWLGFGRTRQKAAELARHDWVLIVDADEELTPGLAQELQQLDPPSERTVYSVRLLNHIGATHVRHGSWGHDHRVRLYNKRSIRWNDDQVHEKLLLPPGTQVVPLQHPMVHYTARSMQVLNQKLDQYALLTASQYHAYGKRSTWLKRNAGPLFAFAKSYLLKLGLLDGRTGWNLASALAGYTARKYKKLYELEKLRAASREP